MNYTSKATQRAKEGGYEADTYSLNDVFMDARFWQALGRAEGWEEHNEKKCLCEYVGEYCFLSHWHRFIDHLIEGKDIESFFANLLHK